jgi:hypothetical protein
MSIQTRIDKLEAGNQGKTYEQWSLNITIRAGETIMEAHNTVTGEVTSDVELVHAIIEHGKERARRGYCDPIEVVLSSRATEEEKE